MKNLQFFLDEEEEEDLPLGLIRLAASKPAHEVFFEINKANDKVCFCRIKDLCKVGKYHDYLHKRFEAYHSERKTCIQIISNKSVSTIKKSQSLELFSDEEDINYLLPFHPEVDYILKTSDCINDFSLILWPENLMFPLQEHSLSSSDELFELIQYYE